MNYLKKHYKVVIILIAIVINLSLVLGISILKKDNYQELANNIYNILQSPPQTANKFLDNYILYVPSEFDYIQEDNSFLLKNESVNISMFLGLGSSIDLEFLDQINPGLEKLYTYSTYNDKDLLYFYVWKYDKDNIQIMIGQNDRNITGIFPEGYLNKSAVELAIIFNSVQEV
ncbi:MAG: hypothetical protein ACK5HS_02555 [Mycoplasmatales bacterium]